MTTRPHDKKPGLSLRAFLLGHSEEDPERSEGDDEESHWFLLFSNAILRPDFIGAQNDNYNRLIALIISYSLP